MPTAYLVDSGNPNGNPSYPYGGPFKYGSQDYVIGFDDDGAGGFAIAVYQSTNQPATIFTELDGSNAPTVRDFTSFWPSTQGQSLVGSAVYFLSRTGAFFTDVSLTLRTFELSTGLYSAAITGGPIGRSGTPTALSFFGGTWTFVYFKFVAGNYDLYWSTYNGAWGAEHFIETVSGLLFPALSSASNSANGDFCITWLTSDTAMKALTISAGAASTPQTISLKLNQVGTGFYVNGDFVFPLAQHDNANNANEIDVMIVSPGNVPTSLTLEQVEPDDGMANSVTFSNPSISSASDGNIYVFYQKIPNSYSQIYIRSRVATGGSWSAATLLFDSSVDTFVPPQPLGLQESNTPFGVVYPDGEIAVLIAAYADFGFPYCDQQFFFSIAGTVVPTCPTITIITTGTPYSSTVTATGGTPPYTFSISAGALPPGLTLNATTGVISGIPTTAGTYTFTVQATDALGNSGTIVCTGGGGGGGGGGGIVVNPPVTPDLCEPVEIPGYNPTQVFFPMPSELQGS